MMRLVSYEYPSKIKLMLNEVVYSFEASEYWCRKMMKKLGKKGEMRVFNEFKKQANLVRREEVKESEEKRHSYTSE